MDKTTNIDLIKVEQLLEEENNVEAFSLLEKIEKEQKLSLSDHHSSQLLKSILLNRQEKHSFSIDLSHNLLKKKFLSLNQKFRALVIAIDSFWHLGKYDEALVVTQQGEKLLKEIDRKRQSTSIEKDRANFLLFKGKVLMSKGNLDAAQTLFKQSLQLFEKLMHKKGIGQVLNNMGIMFWYSGELDTAIDHFQQSLSSLDQEKNKRDIVLSLNNLGSVYGMKGDLNHSLEYFNLGLLYAEQVGNKRSTASILNNIGEIYELKGELELALDFLQRSLLLKEELGNKRYVASTLHNIGIIHLKKGELNEANTFLTKSLELFEGVGNYVDNAKVIVTLLKLTIESQNLIETQNYLHKLEICLEKSNNKVIDLYYRLSKATLLKEGFSLSHEMSFLSLQTILSRIVEAQQLFKGIIDEQEIIDHDITVEAIFNLCEIIILEIRTLGKESLLEEVNTLTERLLSIGEKQKVFDLLVKTYLLQANLALVKPDVQRSQDLLKQAFNIAEEKGYNRLAIVIKNEQKRLEGTLPEWLLEENTSALDRLGKLPLEGLLASLRQNRVEYYLGQQQRSSPTLQDLTTFADALKKRQVGW